MTTKKPSNVDRTLRARQRAAALKARVRELDEVDRIEANITLRLVSEHVVLYFEATEAQRAEAYAEIASAEDGGGVLASSGTALPLGEWSKKWPPVARNAILAVWRTPKE